MIEIIPLSPDKIKYYKINKSKDKFLIDKQTYLYFFNEICKKELDEYISNNLDPILGEINKIDEINDIEDVSKLFHNIDRTNEYIYKFNKRRKKIFVYNEHVYTYVFKFLASGYVIRVFRFELEDFEEGLEHYYELINSSIPKLILDKLRNKI